MGEGSAIEWTHHTFNGWIGCAKVSEGCKFCYASVDTFARRSRANGLELWGENAARHVTSDAYWKQPAKWNRAALAAGERHRVFCSSLADVGEDRADLKPVRARLVRTIEETSALDWLLLTKRPGDMRRLFAEHWPGPWPANVWAGTTVENQERADERIPALLDIPARVRFLSAEPLLGPISIHPGVLGCVGHLAETFGNPLIHWVIVGGESGPSARPFNIRWARSLVEQCQAAGASLFVKQFGANVRFDGIALPGQAWARPGMGEWDRGDGTFRKHLIDAKKGGDMAEWPVDLRIREFPEVTHG